MSNLDSASDTVTAGHDAGLLDAVQRRVLWYAARMVDVANSERPDAGGIKVGGHQASSASVVSIMTALWFAHLDTGDRVSVKPHAAPIYHAIQYLLGNLDGSYLTRLRAFGGLQAYPSRTKDPDGVDFSTGSVGLGAAAPLFGAVTRRYVDSHFGARPPSRFISIVGDAELDEGNVWEAAAEPAAAGLGNVTWIVDLNRQSLDRVVPGVRATQWALQFAAAGWHVAEAKYGPLLRALFGRPGGSVLRAWLDAMSNEQYQSAFGLSGAELRDRLTTGAPPEAKEVLAEVADDDLARTFADLGGHDLPTLLDVLRECDAATDRPSVLFAYTVKGWGLPLAGDARNHSALLTPEQIADLRARTGLTAATEWDRFDPAGEIGRLVARRAAHLQRPARARAQAIAVPIETGLSPRRPTSTQDAFGRVLVALSRDPSTGPRLVSTAPDVATSTNLAGFLNRTGVFAAEELPNWQDGGALKWREHPGGQHIELGISEMNLFLLLGALGLSWDHSAEPLLPVGTVYDPFVCRGLDALIYSAYSGARFVVAGTPSGITLSPEGGAHQSTITASIGVELPNLTMLEPAYCSALDWLLCDALGDIGRHPDGAPGHGGYYFRLTTRPIGQEPFEQARQRLGTDALRANVLAGAYRLRDATELQLRGAPTVHLVGSGAILPELLSAADELVDEHVAAHVVEVTSNDRLYAAWRDAVAHSVRTATVPRLPRELRTVFTAGAPIVTVHDAASHAMSWLGSALGVPALSLGVDAFGQSGAIGELYAEHHLDPGSIVNAALGALGRTPIYNR